MGADDYFKGLTAAELDEHEQIEAELNKTVREGFSEPSAFAFVTTVIAVRRVYPSATIGGIFEVALMSGLDAVLNSLRTETQPASRSKRKTSRPGVRLVT